MCNKLTILNRLTPFDYFTNQFILSNTYNYKTIMFTIFSIHFFLKKNTELVDGVPQVNNHTFTQYDSICNSSL